MIPDTRRPGELAVASAPEGIINGIFIKMKNDQLINELAALSDAELEHEVKKRQGLYWVNIVLIGFMIGVAVYGYSRKGLTFFTVLPLIFIPVIVAGQRRYKEAKEMLKSRKP